MKKLLLLSFILLISSCQKAAEQYSLKPSNWRLVFDLGDNNQLPVKITVNEDQTITIKNANEEILVTEVAIEGDSIFIKPPVFEGYFKGKFESYSLITGVYLKPSLDRIVPFQLNAGKEYRFDETNNKGIATDMSGNYQTVFSPDSKLDRYMAKGVFNQKGNEVTGTYETTTGDYRFLEGSIINHTLKLSTFDGAHVFLFEAVVKDSVLEGVFYSGNHCWEPFTAVLNNEYNLPDAKELTFLKEGSDSIDFSFKDTNGNIVSLNDPEFKDQVVIVQLLGSWCPNCLEETRFYQEYINSRQPNVKFIGLAFEYEVLKKKHLILLIV
jgi:hypothetical protein